MLAVKRALLFSTADRYFALVCNFAIIAAVSRILTPDEIGISVIGTAIVGLTLSIREFASASFLIQRHDLPREVIRGAFTVLLALTIVVAVALAALAQPLALSYGNPKLVPYLHVVSLCLVVELITVPIVTLLRRELAFGKVAFINITGASTGLVATIAFAWLGLSYMSFAWAWLASCVAMNILALLLRPDFWIFKPSVQSWRKVVEFGGYNGGTIFLYRVYESLPYLLLGRIVSPHAAAVFGRSLMICQIPDKLILGGAMSVILPAFSVEAREGRDLKKPYLRCLEMITVFHWPALVVLAILADPVVTTLLGSQWHEVVPLVRIISIASLFSFSFEMNYPVMVAMGAIKQSFRRALIAFPTSAVIITGAVLMGGLEAAAWSMMFIIPFQALVALTFVRRLLGIRWIEIGAALSRSGVVALTSAVGPIAVTLAADPELKLFGIVGAGFLAVGGWLVGVWATGHPLIGELRTIGTGLRQRVVPQAGVAPAMFKD